MSSAYFDLVVSGVPEASVSVRSLPASSSWAYEVAHTGSSSVRGTVNWEGTNKLGLISVVLDDYCRQEAGGERNAG